MLLGRCNQHYMLYLKLNFPTLDLKFGLPLSFTLDASRPSLILGILAANALFSNVAIVINLSLSLLIASCLDISLMPDFIKCLNLRLTLLLSHMM
jgi:hypothetical protein